MENYFTDSLLYQVDIEPLKQSLLDDLDSGNEADSESEEDVPATISIEPIVVYLNVMIVITPSKILNENIAFDYSMCLEDVSVNVMSYTCLYQYQKWHACIFRIMKDLSLLSLFVRGTNHQLYLAEAGLKPRYLENQTMT